MRKLKILVDMDDTITWLLPVWVDYLNNKYSLGVEWSKIKEWDMSLAFPGLTHSQIYEPLATEEIWDFVNPRNDSVWALNKLFTHGHDIYIVTATDYRNIKPKFEKVINKYFPFIRWDNVIVAKNKQMINGDVLIDDAPHNLEGGNYFKILIDTPYNRNYSTKGTDIVRAKSWSQIYSIIMRMSSELEEDGK